MDSNTDGTSSSYLEEEGQIDDEYEEDTSDMDSDYTYSGTETEEEDHQRKHRIRDPRESMIYPLFFTLTRNVPRTISTAPFGQQKSVQKRFPSTTCVFGRCEKHRQCDLEQ